MLSIMHRLAVNKSLHGKKLIDSRCNKSFWKIINNSFRLNSLFETFMFKFKFNFKFYILFLVRKRDLSLIPKVLSWNYIAYDSTPFKINEVLGIETIQSYWRFLLTQKQQKKIYSHTFVTEVNLTRFWMTLFYMVIITR